MPDAPPSWASELAKLRDRVEVRCADATTVGLFTYPVLMAADILIYDSDAVPVGKDQLPLPAQLKSFLRCAVAAAAEHGFLLVLDLIGRHRLEANSNRRAAQRR